MFIRTEWSGYKKIDFTVGGRESIVVVPKQAAPGKPWVWRTEFMGIFDIVDMAMLERGWHLAYHKVSDMFGCPQAIEWMREFQLYVEEKFSLSPFPALFGFSRGGLYAVNFAKTYPENTGLLYLDAPVLDILSWPGGKHSGGNYSAEWEKCKKWYSLTEDNFYDFKGNPLDWSEKLAADNIPVLIIAGGRDLAVPYCENGAIFERRFTAAGGDILTVVKTECDHHPHSLEDPTIAVEFLESRFKKITE